VQVELSESDDFWFIQFSLKTKAKTITTLETLNRKEKAQMKFLQALDIIQESPDAIGMFQAKHPTEIIHWDKKTHRFLSFYTNKALTITKQQLFAADWDVAFQVPIPMNEFTQEVEDE